MPLVPAMPNLLSAELCVNAQPLIHEVETHSEIHLVNFFLSLGSGISFLRARIFLTHIMALQ